jgi:hypothetical protein
MTKYIPSILLTVPPKAWITLYYLVYIAIKATKPQTIWLPKLLIIPLAIISLGISNAVTYADSTQFNVWNVYLVYFTIGSVVSYLIFKNITPIFDQAKRSITLPGGYIILIIFISSFLLYYFYNYIQTIYPELTTLQLIYIKTAILGILAGLSVGRCASYLFKFFKSS